VLGVSVALVASTNIEAVQDVIFLIGFVDTLELLDVLEQVN
jgi:hypothetical protein